MNISLERLVISGVLKVPPSKSMTQRVFAAALLHKGTTFVTHHGTSDDELAALQVIKDLGAEVVAAGDGLMIRSTGTVRCSGKSIHCNESGLAARLFTPIAALAEGPVCIQGKGSLTKRPMLFFDEVLPQLGVTVNSTNGRLPLTVSGPLVPGNIRVDGSLSSQFISGLLFAFAAAAQSQVTLQIEDLVSKPYLDLTLQVLGLFGKEIRKPSYSELIIDPQYFVLQKEVSIAIESDWSSAAFWIAAAAIQGPLVLKGLSPDSLQADRAILPIIQAAGAVITWNGSDLSVSKGTLNAFRADLVDCPDLFPVLAVLAACCEGQSRLNGLHRLVHKESNRAESIMELLRCLHVSFYIDGDSLLIDGGSRPFPTLQYKAPDDHRMVMAAALAACNTKGVVTIENTEAVHKSYPSFWQQLSPFINRQ